MHKVCVWVRACSPPPKHTHTPTPTRHTLLPQNTAWLTGLLATKPHILLGHTVGEQLPGRHGNSLSFNFFMCKMGIIKSALHNSINNSYYICIPIPRDRAVLCSEDSSPWLILPTRWQYYPGWFCAAFTAELDQQVIGKQKVRPGLLPQSFE